MSVEVCPAWLPHLLIYSSMLQALDAAELSRRVSLFELLAVRHLDLELLVTMFGGRSRYMVRAFLLSLR